MCVLSKMEKEVVRQRGFGGAVEVDDGFEGASVRI